MKKIISITVILFTFNILFGQEIIVHQKLGGVYKKDKSEGNWIPVKKGEVLSKGYIKINPGASILISKVGGNSATVFKKAGNQFKISEVARFVSSNSNDAAKVLWNQVNTHNAEKKSRGGVTRSSEDSTYLFPLDSSFFCIDNNFDLATNLNCSNSTFHIFNQRGVDTLVTVKSGFVFQESGEYSWEVLGRNLMNETPRMTIFVLPKNEFDARLKDIDQKINEISKGMDENSILFLREMILESERIYLSNDSKMN
jgi:hypothetical protein